MEEFLGSNYMLLTYSFEILAAVTGIFLYKKYKHAVAKYFIYFLTYLFLADLLCGYTYLVDNNGLLSFLKGTVFEDNYWISTLSWSIGSVIFFVFYFNKILQTKYYKTIVKYAGLFFLFVSIIYILFNLKEFFIRFFPFISVFGAIVIFTCSVFYFVEVLQSDQVLKFYKSLNFYISSAILIWWLIMTPLVFYDIYFKKEDWDFVLLKWQIYLVANFFMYTTFTIGLIISKPEEI